MQTIDKPLDVKQLIDEHRHPAALGDLLHGFGHGVFAHLLAARSGGGAAKTEQSSQELSRLAVEMNEIVGRFKL